MTIINKKQGSSYTHGGPIVISRRYQLSDRDGATFEARSGADVLAQLVADRRAMREGGDVQGLAYVVASAADARALGAHETVGGEWYLPAIDGCLVVRAVQS